VKVEKDWSCKQREAGGKEITRDRRDTRTGGESAKAEQVESVGTAQQSGSVSDDKDTTQLDRSRQAWLWREALVPPPSQQWTPQLDREQGCERSPRCHQQVPVSHHQQQWRVFSRTMDILRSF
jgi:hypothetical protein